MNTALVVPTVREGSALTFIRKWKEYPFDEIIVVEDNPSQQFNLGVKHHYSWEHIEKKLGDDSWIISKRDSACRCFGFLIAYELGAKFIYTLDDDCLPEDIDFIESHKQQMLLTPKWTELIPGMRTRGLPYRSFGAMNNIVANIGLWTNNPDQDSIQQLSNPIRDFRPEVENRIMPFGQYFPFTGMNFCFKHEVAVMSYFPLMGEGTPYSRFDDIWFGIIFKKICDHLGYAISCGRPYVQHSRASDPMTNLVKEAPGIKANEEFWSIIDSIRLIANTAKGCMNEIGASLSITQKDTYLARLGEAMQVWTKYFD